MYVNEGREPKSDTHRNNFKRRCRINAQGRRFCIIDSDSAFPGLRPRRNTNLKHHTFRSGNGVLQSRTKGVQGVNVNYTNQLRMDSNNGSRFHTLNIITVELSCIQKGAKKSVHQGGTVVIGDEGICPELGVCRRMIHSTAWIVTTGYYQFTKHVHKQDPTVQTRKYWNKDRY